MVGPWQVPVADVAVTLHGFRRLRGRGDGDGRAHAARVDRRARRRDGWRSAKRSPTSPPPAFATLADVKLSANWMAPAGHPGEDAALYDTVRAVALELCVRARRRRSRSARIRCRCARRGATRGVDKAVTAPLSLIVSAFAPVPDVRRTLTPLLAARSRRHGAVC